MALQNVTTPNRKLLENALLRAAKIVAKNENRNPVDRASEIATVLAATKVLLDSAIAA